MTISFLYRSPIRRSLLPLTVLTSGIGLQLACAGYPPLDLRGVRQQEVKDHHSRSNLIAMNALGNWVGHSAEIDRLMQSKIMNEGGRMQDEMKDDTGTCRVNFTELLARVDNDRELLSELVSIFKNEFPPYIRNLEEAVARKNVEDIASISHALKGMLSNLAVTGASASASRLEQLARRGDTAVLHDAFVAFKRDVQGLVPEMEGYIEEARP